MEKITKIQYWTLEDKIVKNIAFRIMGTYNYYACPQKAVYYNGQKTYLLHDKTGYWTDTALLSLLND
jgi:hypothetical protein